MGCRKVGWPQGVTRGGPREGRESRFGDLGGGGVDAVGRGGDRGFAGFGAEAELLGADEGDVGQAHEAEEVAEVGLLEVVGGRRAVAVEAAAAFEDDDALGRKQALRALVGVAEGLAGAQDVIEPRAQGGGDAEVVHRRTDDDGVGGAELGDQGVGEGAGRLFGLGGGHATDAGDGVLGQVGNRVAVEVAVDDLGGTVRGEGLDGLADEGARDRSLAGGGAVEDENVAHVGRSLLSGPCCGPAFRRCDGANMTLRKARR